jgi:GDPmannose 4,6-dehydratase
MSLKKALITGINGQDGRYLSKLLHSKGYEIHGTSRQDRFADTELARTTSAKLHQLDILDSRSISKLINQIQPDEVYHLAARSSSAELDSDPVNATLINGQSALHLLQAVAEYSSQSKFLFASSSEVFGFATASPQHEKTTMQPANAYAIAKILGMNWTTWFRQTKQLFAVNAILYNHESPERDTHYVTRKITQAAAKIYCGLQSSLTLGNLDSKRDWTHAADTVRGMWLQMQYAEPIDLIFGSGRLHSVRDVCEVAFDHVGLNYSDFVNTQPDTYRRVESTQLHSDPSLASELLDWRAEISFEDMIREMVDSDLRLLHSSTVHKN